MSVTVFFSYAHKDESLRDDLSEHLSLLKRDRVIQDWHDRQIPAGAEWANEIDRNLNTADIILLLISASFLSSDYCWGKELMRAMQRHEAGEACVIPVILRPCDWQRSPFAKLQAFPKDAKPVTKWDNQDEAFLNVAKGIELAAKKIAERNLKSTPSVETQRIKESGQGEAYYRQEVMTCLREDGGKISPVSRSFLDGMRVSLALSIEQATEIERSGLAPYQTYETTLRSMAEHYYPLTDELQNRLKRLQKSLSLSDEDVALTRQRILSPYEEEVRSEQGMDYKPLRDMLKAKQWKEADQETWRVMCAAMGRQEEGRLRVEDIRNFPCADLRTIDQLWVKYSDGQFGFSVQKQIWQECGSPTDYNKDWEKFGDRVGWRMKRDWISYSDVTFNTNSPRGHLPLLIEKVVIRQWGGIGGACVNLFSRAETCEL
jgi:GUN4-like/TIR domain